MANAEVRGRTKEKRAGRFGWLLLALMCGLGLTYLGSQVDWTLDTISGQQALSEKPPDAKLQAGVLPPSFDVASADERGNLVAAGRSEAGWTIQLKNKSQILGETKADENNEWVLTPETSLPPGEHTLSLLAIDPSGQRSVPGERDSRITVAPRRETAPALTPAQKQQASRASARSPELALTQSAGQNGGKERCVSALVKTGDTLWAIAYHCYGSGTKYTKIFRSNRSLIRNPDLIYPDQRFAVPH